MWIYTLYILKAVIQNNIIGIIRYMFTDTLIHTLTNRPKIDFLKWLPNKYTNHLNAGTNLKFDLVQRISPIHKLMVFCDYFRIKAIFCNRITCELYRARLFKNQRPQQFHRMTHIIKTDTYRTSHLQSYLDVLCHNVHTLVTLELLIAFIRCGFSA